jgi:hypothetical protein
VRTWLLTAAAIIVPGGAIVALVVWLRRRWLARAAARLNAQIKPPRPIYTAHDDSLRRRTVARRKAADGIRQRAVRVETGSPVSDVLRLVNTVKKEA